jgi:hypothetical protein
MLEPVEFQDLVVREVERALHEFEAAVGGVVVFAEVAAVGFAVNKVGDEQPPVLLAAAAAKDTSETVKDAELWVKIVEERGMFDANPKAFRVNYDVTQKELRDQIDNAQAILPNVKVPHDLRVKISQVCSELDVDGLRGDVVSNRAAKALVAFRGRAEVTPEDDGTVMPNFLRYQLRKDPLESIHSMNLILEEFLTEEATHTGCVDDWVELLGELEIVWKHVYRL